MSRGLSPTLSYIGGIVQMPENNAKCSICGSRYYACFSCKDKMNLHPWKAFCCSVDCYKVSQVVRGFSAGMYTKDEFKSRLKNVDLSNLDNYKEHIKALIKDALKEDEVIEVEVPVIEEVKTEEVEEMVVEKPVYSRKRNYKVNKVETE